MKYVSMFYWSEKVSYSLKWRQFGSRSTILHTKIYISRETIHMYSKRYLITNNFFLVAYIYILSLCILPTNIKKRILVFKEFPAVASATRLKRNGVISLPETPWFSAWFKAFVIILSNSVLFKEYSSGTGTPNKMPEPRFISLLVLIIKAASRGSVIL